MAELNLRPCQKCKGAAELKEGRIARYKKGFITGYYVECKKGCCYTPVLPNKILAVTQWNTKRVTLREEGDHANDT